MQNNTKSKKVTRSSAVQSSKINQNITLTTESSTLSIQLNGVT